LRDILISVWLPSNLLLFCNLENSINLLHMERFTGLIGIVLILGIAYAMSNNRKAINYRTVGVGLAIQFGLAVFILRTQTGQDIFQWLGAKVQKLLSFSDKGADFVFGTLVRPDLMQRAFGPGNDFVFFFKVIPTIIFVAVLVNMPKQFPMLPVLLWDKWKLR
jgi:CNT family concentrative nucleoside transporter